MNWDKAKTMLIICLLGLNAFLAAMYFAYEEDYTVSREDVQVIVSLLAENGIALDHTLSIPRRFAPVDQLVLRPPAYNTALLLGAFFADASNINQTIEFGNTIFTSPEGTLTISADTVLFVPSPGAETGRFGGGDNEETAQLAFTRFVRDNAALFPGYELDSSHRELYRNVFGDTVYEFRQVYMGYTILSNTLSFTIGGGGVSEVRFTHFPPVGFVGMRQPIISAPQALFMFKLGSAHLDKPILITRINMAHAPALAADGSGRFTTVPYYRVYSSSNTPTHINAVTGVIYSDTVLFR